jgi:HK97 family phage major capsid protein
MKTTHGRTAARLLRALHATNGEVQTAVSYASAQNWTDLPQIVNHLKGMAIGGLTAEEMARSPIGLDFSACVRPQTVLGRLLGIRKVPMSVRVLTGVGGTGAAFVAQGGPISVSKMDIEGEILYPLKVGSLALVTTELLDNSSPGAEDLLIADLSAACAQAVDEALLDPGNSGIDGEKPAAITSGVTPLSSSGSTFPDIDADLQAMVHQLLAAGSTLVSAVWIVRPQTAIFLSSLRAGDGSTLVYPGLTISGGFLKGLPVVVGSNLSQPGSPTNNYVVLVDVGQIILADDGAAELRISRQGAIQMLDNPTNDSTTPTATTMVSMWQTSCAAVRAVLWINWSLRRKYVSVLSGVGY